MSAARLIIFALFPVVVALALVEGHFSRIATQQGILFDKETIQIANEIVDLVDGESALEVFGEGVKLVRGEDGNGGRWLVSGGGRRRGTGSIDARFLEQSRWLTVGLQRTILAGKESANWL